MNKHSQETKGDLSGIQAGLLGVAEELPFINEIKHLADTVLDKDSKKSFLGEMFKSAIPAVIQQAAGWMDPKKHTDFLGLTIHEGEKDRKGKPVRREPSAEPGKGMLETVELGIPGLRNTVPTADERKRMKK